ncbi:TetR/AcrR family transcriptional regulator [Limnohabitans sp. 2KL-27]|uniref:TetR/AcrR family transcriptional regulator n=1 Tax=Limnohabitans sp. 2KL-27 TaxID=1100705 RepID=UPI000AC49B55|nr:TetR/AcrR family transcriptional regulator [Limnohabitans sp. 2KL-27]
MNTTDPLVPHKRERRKQDRPGELLEAALDLFVEKGFAATRVEEVALRAGVSKGTLFLYFPSKEDLFKAVVRDNVVATVAQGAAEAAQFQGSTGELLEWMMLQWWRRYGATKASGISKLVMSEASNFPDLAIFFRNEVIEPAHALVRNALQRGIDRGEFHPMSVDLTLHSVMAPLLFLVMWKHSMGPCSPSHEQIDPEAFISQHARLMARGLSQA